MANTNIKCKNTYTKNITIFPGLYKNVKLNYNSFT
jgi:hypothetical protein